MTTCNTCGQPLPDQPVYVGPGDWVEYESTLFKVVGKSHRYAGLIVIEGVVRLNAPRVRPDKLRTLDGRPIAGFRDPRDERIKELEAKVSEYVAHCAGLEHEIKYLEHKRPTNPLAGLSDEDIYQFVSKFVYEHSADLSVYPRHVFRCLLRDIRDGKLEVPEGSPKNPEVPR